MFILVSTLAAVLCLLTIMAGIKLAEAGGRARRVEASAPEDTRLVSYERPGYTLRQRVEGVAAVAERYPDTDDPSHVREVSDALRYWGVWPETLEAYRNSYHKVDGFGYDLDAARRRRERDRWHREALSGVADAKRAYCDARREAEFQARLREVKSHVHTAYSPPPPVVGVDEEAWQRIKRYAERRIRNE